MAVFSYYGGARLVELYPCVVHDRLDKLHSYGYYDHGLMKMMLADLFKSFNWAILNEDMELLNSILSNNLLFKNNETRLRATLVSNYRISNFSNNDRGTYIYIDKEKAKRYILDNGYIIAGVTNIYFSTTIDRLKVKLGWIKSTNIKRSYGK